MKNETVNILKALLDRDEVHPILSSAERKAIEYLLDTVDLSCWVEIDEKFPEESGEYLVTFKDYYIPEDSRTPQPFYNRDVFSFIAESDIEKKYSEMNWRQSDVIAWTPIPDVYFKEDSHDDGAAKDNTDNSDSVRTDDTVN